jgi:hypothetical protein
MHVEIFSTYRNLSKHYLTRRIGRFRIRNDASESKHFPSHAVIDISTEDIITFTEAGDLVPRRRKGRKTHPSTFWRWSEYGLRGVKLEVLYIGGSRCTSVQALQRFFDRLRRVRNSGTESVVAAHRTAAQRKRDNVTAAEELQQVLYTRKAQTKRSSEVKPALETD